MKDNVQWVKCVLCVVYQVALSLQLWRFVLRLLDVLGLVVIGDLALSSMRRGLANLQH